VGAGFAFGLALSPGFIGVCIALGVTVGVLLLVSARVIFIHPWPNCGTPFGPCTRMAIVPQGKRVGRSGG
jgi:uncharacterized oligopeptide transporter (OPT) family protein